MAKGFETFSVPPDLVREVDIAVQIMREAMAETVPEQEQVVLIVPKARPFDTGALSQAILYLPLAAAAWFTHKWADEYLWPTLKERLDGPSRKAVEWLLGAAGDVAAKEPDDG